MRLALGPEGPWDYGLAMVLDGHIGARLLDLGFNVSQAAAVPRGRLVRSLFGDFGARVAADIPTEWDALAPLDRAAIGTAIRVLLPLPPLGPFAREASGPVPDRQAPRAGEAWFFINGVCCDRRIARINVEALARIFERPITLLYNATDGLLSDLFECAANKAADAVTEAVAANLLPVVTALVDERIERVVLLSHSQGTVIAAVMLKWLDEVLTEPGRYADRGPGAQRLSPERHLARCLARDPAELAASGESAPVRGACATAREARRMLQPDHIRKLELYCFANCATSMSPIEVTGQPPRHAPWIESYGNEYDVVARLGVLAPPHGIGSTRIGGERYRRDGTWGHLLNAHYLAPMLDDLAGCPGRPALVAFGENLRTRPRLLEYVGGGTPPAYP